MKVLLEQLMQALRPRPETSAREAAPRESDASSLSDFVRALRRVDEEDRSRRSGAAD